MILTSEQIAERNRLAYKTLGRFLGVAEMLEEKIWRLTPEKASERMVEIMREYREGMVEIDSPTAAAIAKAVDDGLDKHEVML